MNAALQHKNVIYLGLGLFIILNSILIAFDQWWLSALPVALIIVGVALFRTDLLLLLIVFATPLSVTLEELEFGLGVHLPTEPLMFGAMMVFIVKLFYDGKFDKSVALHPISIVIYANLIWIFIAVFPSELPLVSLKFLVSRLWFVLTFYFMATTLFKKGDNMERFLWMFIIPLSGVIIYTIFNHAMRGFAEKPAHWVMQPFFKDHTSYGAIIAMYIPILWSFAFNPRFSLNAKIINGFFFTILLAGVIFSFTRAAWVSLVLGLIIYFLIYFKVKIKVLFVTIGFSLFLLFNFQNEIIMALEKYKQDSSNNLAEHVESISNVASDASNLERINRWSCALRMFAERPVFGHGPGTYAFLYAPYQHSSQLTIISTNFGDGGNAHSEYFGPLAETGALGLLTFLAIILVVYFRGIRMYQRLEDKRLKSLTMGVIIGLSTYLIHGLLNNFLDTDKASVPFWGFIAILVAIEVYHEKSVEAKTE